MWDKFVLNFCNAMEWVGDVMDNYEGVIYFMLLWTELVGFLVGCKFNKILEIKTSKN